MERKRLRSSSDNKGPRPKISKTDMELLQRFWDATDWGTAQDKGKGDWTLPGHNYMGPGNDMNKGPPTNHNDLVSYVHDQGYENIQEAGDNPYTTFSTADQTAIENYDDDFIGEIGKGVFKAKKLAHAWGLMRAAEAGDAFKTPDKPKKRRHEPTWSGTRSAHKTLKGTSFFNLPWLAYPNLSCLLLQYQRLHRLHGVVILLILIHQSMLILDTIHELMMIL